MSVECFVQGLSLSVNWHTIVKSLFPLDAMSMNEKRVIDCDTCMNILYTHSFPYLIGDVSMRKCSKFIKKNIKENYCASYNRCQLN